MTVNEIAKLSLPGLQQALAKGAVTESDLRGAYKTLRHRAQQRERSTHVESVVKEFGNTERTYFTKPSNLVTQSKLLHELADVNRYLKSKASTITGLKQTRKNVINAAEKQGFDVDKGNYRQFVEFMKWFHASEYAKKYDSDSEEVAEVFNSEKATRGSWQKAFKAFEGSGNGYSPVRQY